MSTEMQAKRTPPDLAQIAFDNSLARTPWLLEHRRDGWFGNQIAVTDSNHCVICRVPPAGSEQFKIANLIATAPDLLKACKALLALVPHDKLHPFGYTDEPQDKANDMARDAIARAEGRAT